MKAAGLTNVGTLKGGYEAWANAALPTATGANK